MKKITISITSDIRRDRRMRRTAAALANEGYEITILFRKIGGAPISDLRFNVLNIRCWFTNGIAFYFEFNIRLFFKLIWKDVDLLLPVDTDTLLANTLVSILKRKPMVVDMHEWFTEVPELQGKSIKKWIWNRIEFLGIRRSSNRYTVSNSLAEVLSKKHGKPFQTVRNVPQIRPLVNRASTSQFTIAYLGVINRGRGIRPLLHAITSIPDASIMLIGKGDEFGLIQAEVSQLGLEKQVQFLGWQEPENIQALLTKANIGVNLLVSDSLSYYNSLANKYFDYIHAGLPSINMNFPEYRRLNAIYRTSLLIDRLSVDNIRSAILMLKNNSELYKELQQNCLNARQVWNWQEEKKSLLSIFDRADTWN